MNTVKRIAKNTLVLTGADIFGKILQLILVAYIARYLGDVGFGKYSFAFSSVGFGVHMLEDALVFNPRYRFLYPIST